MSNETVVLRTGGTYWYHISQEKLEAIQRLDAETGNTCDSAGEPRIYTTLRSGIVDEDTLVTITRRRNIPWNCYRTKPSHLVEGLATIVGVPQIIMFQCKPNRNRGRLESWTRTTSSI